MKRQDFTIILIDLDGTLFDFQAAEKRSLQMVFAGRQLELTKETEEMYKNINHSLWSRHEKGEITREEVLNSRFTSLFQKLGIREDGIQFERAYQGLLAQSVDLIQDAEEIAEYLSSKYKLYVVSNGVASTQMNRLKLSGLERYMTDVFVSETVGYQKPAREFFDYCFRKIGEPDRERVLLIGDSLTADMCGGNAAGVKTCWYNPQKLIKEGEVKIDYEIRALRELYQIC